jgi:hypothetical protein
VLDIDLDVRISGVISLGGGKGRHRFRIEQVPRGVLRALRAAAADIGEDVRVEQQGVRLPYQDESLRLLPYSGGSSAGDEVRQFDRHDRPGDREMQTPNISHSQHEAAEPRSHDEVAEAERLLKSLASALALRLLGRAATKTRQAIAEAKRAMKSKDGERIRQANERLREAAMRLAEAMRRVSAAAATDEERSLVGSGVVDAEPEPTTAT